MKVGMTPLYPGTRNFLTFANTTAIAYHQNLAALRNLWPTAIATVFTNVRTLRVLEKSEQPLEKHGTSAADR